MKMYRTTFCIRLREDGQMKQRRVVVRCSDDDYFFYNLLTKGVLCGRLDRSAAHYAESHFFFNGYNWIDGGPRERETAEDGT